MNGRRLVVYEPRLYRQWHETPDLVTFDVQVRETDLRVRAARDLSGRTRSLVQRFRRDIEDYAEGHPDFLRSLTPLPLPAKCPGIVEQMLRAARTYEVGPMAAVAGAVAEAVGHGLLADSSQCIVENGGDVFVCLDRPVRLGLFAGKDSPFTRRLTLLIDSTDVPLGVCASSGTVGHSLSAGHADAVVAVAPSAALADAAATAIGNRVKSPADVQTVLGEEQERAELKALVIAIGRCIGAFGDVELAT